MSTECTQSTLVEALYDGRLGPQESSSIERHIGVCDACAELASDLDRLRAAVREPREPATPLHHQRARNSLLRSASELPAVAPKRRATYVAFAAALCAIAAIGWAGGRATAPSARPALALHLRAPRVRLENAVVPSAGARFERERNAELDVVTLANGALDVTVARLGSGERFVVKTSDAVVEARTAAFHIEAEQGKIRGVTVSEGSVEVRYAGFTAVIPAGGSWNAKNEGPTTADNGSSQPPASTPTPVAVAPTSAPREPKVAVAQRETPAPSVDAAPPPAPPGSSAPVAAPASSSPASREFAAAMQALGRGDYDHGAAALDAFATAHPTDARADEADYVRAVALQRAGHAPEAAAAAKRYLATRPVGAHRGEARQISGE